MNDLAIATIRTVCPSLIGALGSWFALKGLQLDQNTLNALTIGLTGLLTAIYYLTVRLLSKAYPSLEWLLGIPKTPNYK